MMNCNTEEEFLKDAGRRKTKILSAEELFRWRKKEVLPVPQRGGVKDFEPDDSWLQDKRLETFYEEHRSVLSEPRVEKSGNLVKGTWDSERRLVNIEKTAKFWMKMGFADNDRNWLHPEEALFLMEVNCLELLHGGVSLSLQEAHSLLLNPSCNVSEEEYQVFAHLRRLGYIVLRHAGKLDVTAYEMKIGLHSYSKKKHKKPSTQSKNTQSQSPATHEQMNLPSMAGELMSPDERHAGSKPGQEKTNSCDNRIDKEHTRGESSNAKKSAKLASALQHTVSTSGVNGECQSENDTVNSIKNKRQCEDSKEEKLPHKKLSEKEKRNHMEYENIPEDYKKHGSECGRCSEETSNKKPVSSESPLTPQTSLRRTDDDGDVSSDDTSEEPPKKKMKPDNHSGSCSILSQETDFLYSSNPWSDATQRSLSGQSCLSLTEWDFSNIHFPDIGGKETVSLPTPPSHCLPPNVCVDEDYEDICMFDVEEYRQQQHLSSSIDPEDGSRHIRQLEFSYAAWYQDNFRPVSARNWREWKEGFSQREKSFLHDSPVAHLWQGEVTPLVQPQDAHSTDALLKRLSVIQPFEGPFPSKQSRQRGMKISFDVYLPNTTFRKSCPGLPDHRVCVARGSHPPDVFDVHATTAHLDDHVPLHWAVVSSGDICFFVFEDLDLPVHPSSLG